MPVWSTESSLPGWQLNKKHLLLHYSHISHAMLTSLHASRVDVLILILEAAWSANVSAEARPCA